MKKLGIFEKRVNLKPLEYPELYDFVDAINHSYWIHSEYSYEGDVHNYFVDLKDNERNAVKNAMLAISQIEISVKRFWSNLYNQFPKPEFDALGVCFGECHIEGTEILTPTGWVNFKDLKENQQVMQYHEDNTLSICNVEKIHINPYNGKMYRIYKNNTNAIITPNHRIVYYNNKGQYLSKTIEELGVKNSNNRLPEAAKLQGNIYELSSLERLYIAIQADGSSRYWRNNQGERIRRGSSKNSNTYEISVKKERKKERLLSLLKDANVEYRVFNDKRGYLKLEFELDQNNDYKTFDWVNLNDKSYQWCLEFINELAHWDGYFTKNKKDCKIKYSTTNKKCADVVQAIGTCAGYKTNMITYKDDRKETFNDVYTVSFLENRERVQFSALKSELIDYVGNTYCVTVPSGAIVTRYNNKTLIAGNSEVRHQRSYSHILELLGLNDEFEKLENVEVIQGRIDYLSKYLKNASSNNKELYILTLALFSLFVENASLFSQFFIIKSFNKEKNYFKGIDNVVMASSKEEHLHATAGAYIVNLVKKEHPEMFTEEFYTSIKRACRKAYEAELKIIDWIFEKGDLEFLSKGIVIEYLKNRFNTSMEMIDVDPLFEVNKDVLKHSEWFDIELFSENHVDFFNKTPTNYTKKAQSITKNDIF